MKISRIDTQLVITNDVAASQRFYHETFDLQEVTNDNLPAGSVCLRAGHQLLAIITPAIASQMGLANANPGSCYINLVTKDAPSQVLNHLKSYYVTIDHEWQQATGAEGTCHQLQLRDPDANVVILTSY